MYKRQEPGEVYRCEIDLWETAIVFNKGHRIRVSVSSSNYPRFQVNGNTADPPGPNQPKRKALNTVFFDRSRASHLFVRVPVTGFRRGDGNGDAKVDIADVIFLLAFLFTGSEAPQCEDSCDVNDDGKLDISDPISLLGFLFSNGNLPDPGLQCGQDPTQDLLNCSSYEGCPPIRW